MSDPSLDRAYSLKTPEDSKELYRDWATTYDAGFAETHGYVAPRKIAETFLELATDNLPLLDVGAGTGLLAEHLRDIAVDGLDISTEMLAVAEAKGLYRNLIEANLLETLPFPDGHYGGIVSSGTFTHGHVGPDCLPELLRITRSGGLFVCSTGPAVYDGAGFGSALARLVAARAIAPVDFREITIYENAEHDHADDRGLVMIFRKL
jgi:predicted TPR repeat methyltransferase